MVKILTLHDSEMDIKSYYLFVCLPIGGSVKSICFENPTACFWCYNWMDELGFGGLEYKM